MIDGASTPWRSGGLFVIAGPCAIESRAFAIETAEELKAIFAEADVPFVYKSSFDKANRTSGASFRGVGLSEGLDILAEVRARVGVPVVTDVHDAAQAAPAAAAVDMLQTPAFLCRQTDFIAAVAATGKPVNIKKGQFLAPWDMAKVADKARAAAIAAGHGDPDILVCERGATFGVRQPRRRHAWAADHGRDQRLPGRVRRDAFGPAPGAMGDASGGERRHAPALARAAVATGAVSGVFMEAHPDPDRAPCDGPNMLPFDWLPELLDQLKAIHRTARPCA